DRSDRRQPSATMDDAAHSCRELRAAKAEFCQAGLDFRAAHEKFPDKTRQMVLDHDYDRALVDRETGIRHPLALLAEGILQSVVAPDSVAEPVVEMPERRKAFNRRVWERRQGRARRDYAKIVGGRVRIIAIEAVARRQAPAICPIASKAFWIAQAIFVVDP